MIPILFSEDSTSFTTNGLGALSDVKSCVVTEERNGAFELEMEYPVDGNHFDDIAYSRIIYTKANQDQDAQAFRIYKISKPLNGLVTINAEHISYQLSYIPSGGFTATSCANALAGLVNYAYESCPFTFSTDNTTSATYTQTLPRSIRSSLGGVDGSILDTFGGEYKWDNFTVYNLSARGSDNGVVLRYGKNITDITQEENIENTYTGVCPYWYSEESGMVTLSEHVLHASTAENFPFQRTVMLDMTESFEDAPTEAELRTAATTYMTNNNIGIPEVSIEVSFVNLADTEEYADVAPLESVGLCDYVHIYFEKLGVSATAKVVRTEYDSILERYNKIELGDAKSTFGDTIISAIQSTSSDKVSFTALENAVQRATSLITGNSGGYVRFVYNDDNLPEEILIMDTEDIDTATKVWRWNQNGLGYSSTGYDGTYALAMTQDGAIVADFITTGTLDASQATITNLDADSITTGSFSASGSGGSFALDADTGELTWTMSNSSLGSDGNITWTMENSTLDSSGVLTLYDGDTTAAIDTATLKAYNTTYNYSSAFGAWGSKVSYNDRGTVGYYGASVMNVGSSSYGQMSFSDGSSGTTSTFSAIVDQIFLYGDLYLKGNMYYGGWAAFGETSITPSAANTPTATAVTWSLNSSPKVTATPVTAYIGTSVLGVSVTGTSSTGCNIWVTRASTSSTTVYYIALCGYLI